jgi:small GTP-binding protein
MLPVVAIVGRPNVGKSTLFNRLTRTRNAVISDTPGTTRDRQFGEVSLDHRNFIIIDTGGITAEHDEVDQLTHPWVPLKLMNWVWANPAQYHLLTAQALMR